MKSLLTIISILLSLQIHAGFRMVDKNTQKILIKSFSEGIDSGVKSVISTHSTLNSQEIIKQAKKREGSLFEGLSNLVLQEVGKSVRLANDKGYGPEASIFATSKKGSQMNKPDGVLFKNRFKKMIKSQLKNFSLSEDEKDQVTKAIISHLVDATVTFEFILAMGDRSKLQEFFSSAKTFVQDDQSRKLNINKTGSSNNNRSPALGAGQISR